MKSYLEPEEIALIEQAAINTRDRLLIHLLFHLGCRISEALAIKVEDVDFAQSTVNIIHLKHRIKIFCPACKARLASTHQFCPSCGGKIYKGLADEQRQRRQRVLPIDHDTLGLIDDFLKRGGPILNDGKRLLFNISRHRAWQIVKECGDRAGLPKLVNPETGKVHNVSPHKLRDAFAVHAVKHDDSGDGLRLLQEHLGHQSFNTTARYRKVAGEEHREWYEKLWQ
jgi:integrase/recombinase XerD